MPNSAIDIIKVWTTFIVALLISFLFLLTIGICWFFRSIVQLLAKFFKRKKFGEMLGSMERYFMGLEPKIWNQPNKTFCAIVVLEGTVDLEKFRSMFVKHILHRTDENGHFAYGRLQQYPTAWFGYSFYQWVSDFQISKHINLSKELNIRNVNSFLSARMTSPFEKNESMWEILLAPNFDLQGNTGVYLRFHHSLGDGYSIIKMLLTLDETNFEISVRTPQAPASDRTSFLDNVYQFVRVPTQFLQEAASVRHFNQHHPNIQSYVSTTNRIDLNALKRVKTKLGVPLTCVLHTAISSAVSEFLNDYHNEVMPKDKLDYITGMLTFLLPGHAENKLTNEFGLVNLNIPLSEDGDLVSRLRQSKETMKNAMQSVSPKVIGLISKLGNHLPSWLFKALVIPSPSKTPGILLSNLPGTNNPVHVLDCPVLDVSFWIASNETPWLTFAIFSYNGALKIGCSGAFHVFKSQEIMDRVCTRLEIELNQIISMVECFN